MAARRFTPPALATPPPHPSKGRERRGRKKGKEEEKGRGREGLRWINFLVLIWSFMVR